jgi:competence protein ComEA
MGAALLAAVVLAVIGATAGARSPAVDEAAPAPGAPAAVTPTPTPGATPRASPSLGALAEGATSTTDAGAEPGSGITADGRVILNVASEEELTRLPAIGPSRARAIVALRQRLAKFRAVEDLLRVKGIGRKTLRRIKPNVVLDRPPAAGAGPPTPAG